MSVPLSFSFPVIKTGNSFPMGNWKRWKGVLVPLSFSFPITNQRAMKGSRQVLPCQLFPLFKGSQDGSVGFHLHCSFGCAIFGLGILVGWFQEGKTKHVFFFFCAGPPKRGRRARLAPSMLQKDTSGQLNSKRGLSAFQELRQSHACIKVSVENKAGVEAVRLETELEPSSSNDQFGDLGIRCMLLCKGTKQVESCFVFWQGFERQTWLCVVSLFTGQHVSGQSGRTRAAGLRSTPMFRHVAHCR